MSGRLTLISGTDPRSMATMHALHAHWHRVDGGGDDDDDEEEDEDDDDSQSKYSGGGILALTPRTTSSSSSAMNHPQHQHQRSTAAAASTGRHRLRTSEVCEVAGLSALATGDFLSTFPDTHTLTEHAHMCC